MKKQNTARAHRFTVLDGIILAVLLLIVAGAVYFIFFADVADGSASEKTVPIAFTVECQNLADEFLKPMALLIFQSSSFPVFCLFIVSQVILVSSEFH